MVPKKNLKKKCMMFALGCLLSFSSLFSTVVYAKEYEDQYKNNSKIESRYSEDYEVMYTVNNHAGMDQHVVLTFVAQDHFQIAQNDFIYKFDAKFNSEEEYSTYGFEFDLGSPIEYGELDHVKLGDEDAIVYKAQFGIYPGFYNFYHYSYNYLGRGSSVCFIKTLSPNGLLKEENPYASEMWVEVEEGVDPRIYAIIGEKEWIEKVESDFENWAKDYEAKVVENLSQNPQPETEPESTENVDATEEVDNTEEGTTEVIEESSEEPKDIYSGNPRHYEEVKNDEAIEDTQSRLEMVTIEETGEKVGSVSYVAVDGLGKPLGQGKHDKGKLVVAIPEPNIGYRFVNLRSNEISFSKVFWSEKFEKYCYEFITTEGDATIYFYYEPKDYKITLDKKLEKYVTVQPYADEGEEVPIRISEDCPHDIYVLFDGESIEDIKNGNGRLLNIIDKEVVTPYIVYDELGNEKHDTYSQVFEMYGESIKLVAVNEKTNVLVPIAVVGVVGVAGFVGVSYYKKKK